MDGSHLLPADLPCTYIPLPTASSVARNKTTPPSPPPRPACPPRGCGAAHFRYWRIASHQHSEGTGDVILYFVKERKGCS